MPACVTRTLTARGMCCTAPSLRTRATLGGDSAKSRATHIDEPLSLRGDYGVAYTFPTLTSDGHVLFSNWVEEGNIRRFKLLDPAWLYETRQECDFSNGLDDWSVFGSKGVELQPHPEKSGANVLAIRKADVSAGWAAAGNTK